MKNHTLWFLVYNSPNFSAKHICIDQYAFVTLKIGIAVYEALNAASPISSSSFESMWHHINVLESVSGPQRCGGLCGSWVSPNKPQMITRAQQDSWWGAVELPSPTRGFSSKLPGLCLWRKLCLWSELGLMTQDPWAGRWWAWLNLTAPVVEGVPTSRQHGGGQVHSMMADTSTVNTSQENQELGDVM